MHSLHAVMPPPMSASGLSTILAHKTQKRRLSAVRTQQNSRSWEFRTEARYFKILYYTGSAKLRQSGRERRNRPCRNWWQISGRHKICPVPERVLPGGRTFDLTYIYIFSIYFAFQAILRKNSQSPLRIAICRSSLDCGINFTL